MWVLIEGYMDPIDDRDFVEEITRLAGELQLTMALRDALFASSRQTGIMGDSQEEIAFRDAENLLMDEGIRDQLFLAPTSTTTDIGEVAKVVAKVLMPLALSPAPLISPTPLAFAAVAVLILRSGRGNRYRP
jgi:hypothetical protein